MIAISGKRHEKRDRGPPAQEAAEARTAAGSAYAYVAGYGVSHSRNSPLPGACRLAREPAAL